MEFVKLPADGRRSHRSPVLIKKQGTVFPPFLLKPDKRISTERSGDIDAPYLVAFGKDIHPPPSHIFDLKEEQLTDPDTGGSHEADDEVVKPIAVPQETPLQIFVIRLADDIVQKCLLLDLQHGDLRLRHVGKFQKTVERPDSQIHSLRLVAFQQITLVQLKIFVAWLVVQVEELANCKGVDDDGVVGHVALCQPLAEGF